MKLTKDEAWILSACISEHKYELTRQYAKTKGDALLHIDALEDLEKRLEAFSKDQRRTGRRSIDGFRHALERFIQLFKNKSPKDYARSDDSGL